jgi:hypothetical protein
MLLVPFVLRNVADLLRQEFAMQKDVINTGTVIRKRHTFVGLYIIKHMPELYRNMFRPRDIRRSATIHSKINVG